jgi:hypothetical protein
MVQNMRPRWVFDAMALRMFAHAWFCDSQHKKSTDAMALRMFAHAWFCDSQHKKSTRIEIKYFQRKRTSECGFVCSMPQVADLLCRMYLALGREVLPLLRGDYTYIVYDSNQVTSLN